MAIQQEGDRYQQEEDLDTVYLNIIGSGSPTSKSWNIPIKVNKYIISFKLDTGAEVTGARRNGGNSGNGGNGGNGGNSENALRKHLPHIV